MRRLVPAPESVADGRGGDRRRRPRSRRRRGAGLHQNASTRPRLRRSSSCRRVRCWTATECLDSRLRAGLELAIANVGAVAAGWELPARRDVTLPGEEISLRRVPVTRAGVYVPGGRAPYPSTVVMGVVTARVAGVAEIAVCAPPGATVRSTRSCSAPVGWPGPPRSSTGWAAPRRSPRSRYGTDSVTAVDVIVGPGNLYVQEAKRQVLGHRRHRQLRRAERPPAARRRRARPPGRWRSICWLRRSTAPARSWSPPRPTVRLLDALARELDAGAGGTDFGAVVRLVELDGLEQGLALAQAFAPEHLQLAGPEAEALAPRCTRAGCVFVGAGAGTAFGDYIAGSNHVLPTAGAARFASGLTPAHFQPDLHRGSASTTRTRAGAGGSADRAGRGIRAPRAVDGGPHRRQWSAMTPHRRDRPRHRRDRRSACAWRWTGPARASASTGVGFLDHMLDLLARHGALDLDVHADGDLQTGAHHTVEDVGICIGQALDRALGDRAGIVRYGQATCRWTRPAPRARSTSPAAACRCSTPSCRRARSATSTTS